MARTKEYDRDAVLSKAASVFWEKGFEASSMSDLVEATGLNSASMYKEFGSKEGLFESALDSYREIWLDAFLSPLAEEPGMGGIDRFLTAIEENASDPNYTGCLMMNTIAERNVVSKGAVDRIEKFCARLEKVLERAIRGAQKDGNIPSARSALQLARFVVCFIQGMVLFGRVDANKKHIGEVIGMLRAALKA